MSEDSAKLDIMQHPQDDLLIVYAHSLLAQEYKGSEKEEWALYLASKIADQHGLTISEAIRQLN
ncbi:hypothetical protein [Halopiger xanaduensis]|uniref:Uncharacterized protein n=1 Tax=Halopiger xanaduensis (strain DSM 18323 / JCM 14033 / SH-6) TaxID=797210 RepID=F8DDR9_HALXS|nr:hypothetical protein [Halopiger xanaduensis]AEH39172.1 hypothetical protein Halxa_0583 [Halopiger xanaduensis SH-6]